MRGEGTQTEQKGDGMILGIEREIEIDGVTFTVRPEQFDDFIAALGLGGGDGDAVTVSLARLGNTLIRRIVSWRGVELADGSAAPCTDEMKMRLFGQRPDLVGKLAAAIGEGEEAEKKTSEPSANG